MMQIMSPVLIQNLLVTWIFKKFNAPLCFNFLEKALDKALKLSIIEDPSIFHGEKKAQE